MNKKGFTLLELIIVIVIIGVLASMGFIQYSKVVESSRLAEAKVQIGNMQHLAYEYYLKHGSLAGIQNSDVGVNYTCTSTNFYRYSVGDNETSWLELAAVRCASGGKTPNASREYNYYLRYYPGTGQSEWYCYYLDTYKECIGLPVGTIDTH